MNIDDMASDTTNPPPEPIEPAPPLSEIELGEFKEDMAILKNQPSATAASLEATAAVSRLTKLAHATGAYIAKQADNFVTAAMKKSGEKIADLAFWYAIVYLLQNFAATAQQWWQSLPQP